MPSARRRLGLIPGQRSKPVGERPEPEEGQRIQGHQEQKDGLKVSQKTFYLLPCVFETNIFLLFNNSFSVY